MADLSSTLERLSALGPRISAALGAARDQAVADTQAAYGAELAKVETALSAIEALVPEPESDAPANAWTPVNASAPAGT